MIRRIAHFAILQNNKSFEEMSARMSSPFAAIADDDIHAVFEPATYYSLVCLCILVCRGFDIYKFFEIKSEYQSLLVAEINSELTLRGEP